MTKIMIFILFIALSISFSLTLSTDAYTFKGKKASSKKKKIRKKSRKHAKDITAQKWQKQFKKEFYRKSLVPQTKSKKSAFLRKSKVRLFIFGLPFYISSRDPDRALEKGTFKSIDRGHESTINRKRTRD